jgi:Na+-transporting NADH:ubiquinone oxidoreductase subunit F
LIASALSEILTSVGLYAALVMVLVGFINIAKHNLIPSGDVKIDVNGGQKDVTTQPGGKLLGSLADQGIFVASACGGGGTCAQCIVKVTRGGGSILPTEKSHINRGKAKEGYRLACQVAVKQDMDVHVPAEALETKKWTCKVKSNDNVATFIKEPVFELPEGEDVGFDAGGYIQIEIPKYKLQYTDFHIPEEYRPDWDKYDVWRYGCDFDGACERAYSMANFPGERGMVKLNVRVATPPPGAPDNTPPGQASSYIFNLKPGDEVQISGPYGEFFINESDAEMIYIGGGAGMAPLRSHVFELLRGRKSKRKISYWYGGRSLREVFYREEFEQLEREFPNFKYHLVLSQPSEDDKWDGHKGFVHSALSEHYLNDHDAPEDCEYYMCGPPMMVDAALEMLDHMGVERENIYFDDFGG